jgi:AraC family transcriptional activator of mtrCDE
MSRENLDRLMATLAVADVKLSHHVLRAATQYAVAGKNTPTIHYGLTGTCFLHFDREPPVRLDPHTLVIAPANKPLSVTTMQGADGFGRVRDEPVEMGVTALPTRQGHTRGHSEATFISGSFRASYGATLGLFASLTSLIVESFDQHDQLDKVMNYALAEQAAGEPGSGAMSEALFKQMLFTLLRRSMSSENPWIERFALLSDPPVARAFAQMASRPSDRHTAQSLSQAVGLSRSAFMARFHTALSDSPMSVLRVLRMRLAAGLLSANAQSVDQVALSAGYKSRSSFTRAFRRHYDSDPSAYRALYQRAAASETSEAMGQPSPPTERSAAD